MSLASKLYRQLRAAQICQVRATSKGISVFWSPGLLYLCMKHITDRYNMYYSYAPTKLNAQIHMAAVYQAIFAPLLGLFWMLFFSILRVGGCPACSLVPPLPDLCPVSPLRYL